MMSFVVVKSRQDFLISHSYSMADVSARQSLPKNQNIRLNQVSNETIASSPETSRNLIEDQQSAKLVAKFARPLQEINAVNPHPPRTLKQRLSDHTVQALAISPSRRQTPPGSLQF